MTDLDSKAHNDNKNAAKKTEWTRPRSILEYLLEEATECRMPKRPRAIFKEQDDLLSPEGRSLVFDFLMDLDTPFYTLDELAGLSDKFADHLELNRKHLLSSHYLKTPFTPSRWLEWHFTPLYPLNLPASVSLKRSEEGHLEYSYVWDEPALTGVEDRREAGEKESPNLLHLIHAPQWAFESYSEAANCSETILNAQISILRELAKCVDEGSRLTPLSRSISATKFSAKAVRYFLWHDEEYLKQRVEQHLARVFSRKVNLMGYAGGTISALFAVIGHCEKEMTIGTFSETKTLIARTERSRLAGTRIESYDRALGQSWKNELDKALDGFVALAKQEEGFWNDFQERVNHAVENQFPVVVNVAIRDKPSMIETKRRFAEDAIDFADRLAKDGTTAPSKHLTNGKESELKDDVPENVFRKKQDDMWVIRFQGKEILLTDRKGLAYLARLLAYPGHSFASLELVSPTVSGSRQHVSTKEALDSELTIRRGSLHESVEEVDHRSLEDLKTALKGIRKEKQDAEDTGNEALSKELRELEDKITARIKRVTGIDGLPRTMPDEVSRARTSVSKAISRAMKGIKKKHEPLYHHLVRSLRVGYVLSYDPQPPICWLT